MADCLMDDAGDLSGTTAAGGAANDGVVYELAKGSSPITDLLTFNGSNGAGTDYTSLGHGQLSSNLYGTTFQGGASDLGTVFEVAKQASFETVVHVSRYSHADDHSRPQRARLA